MVDFVTCPKCERTSHHPMDVFFKWCPACKLNHSGVHYEDWDRYRIGRLHEAHPDWTLEQVVSAAGIRPKETH